MQPFFFEKYFHNSFAYGATYTVTAIPMQTISQLLVTAGSYITAFPERNYIGQQPGRFQHDPH